MEHLFEHIAALSLTARLTYSILGIVLIRSAFRVLERTLPAHFGHGDDRYRVRKIVTAGAYLIILIFIAVLFEDRLKQAGLAVGFLGAGIVVALQDVIASLGGFLAIGFSNLYRVGDRIQVGLVFNYSQEFRFVWDEIKIRLTSGSDHQQAREMLLRVAKETISDYLVEAQGSWKRIVENYRIQNPLLEPTVSLQAGGGSLEFSLSYVVDYTRRTIVKDQLFTKIVDEVVISKGELEWASFSTTVMLQPAIAEFARAAQPRSSAPGGDA